MRFNVKHTAAIAAVALATFGIAAPSFATTRDGTMNSWNEGDQSSDWKDTNTTSTVTNVKFYATCSHDFTARIRRNNVAFDTTMASERINCTSYNDAVVGGNYPSDKYHLDVQEHYLSGGYIVYPNLRGDFRITW
jgi:hypothetical protein